MLYGNLSYIAFPLLAKGTLLDLLMRANYNNGCKPRRKLSLKLQKYLCRQVCKALVYLHRADETAHGDVKPDNSMITDDFRVILIDLGHAQPVKRLIKHQVGTPAYRGPEVVDGVFFSVERADVYALACTFCTIFFQDITFNPNKVDVAKFNENYPIDPEATQKYFFTEHYKNFWRDEHVQP